MSGRNDCNKNLIILLPDTRFLNELDFIRKKCGKYILVKRFNEDRTQYIDKDRDPNHPSENEIEGIDGDYLVYAKSGEMDLLKQKSIEIIEDILKNDEK